MWEVKKSKLHGRGVFANKNIKKGTKIIQYIGEKISKLEGDKRSEKRIKKYLKSEKTGSVYIFELNKKFDIDGNIKQNKARFINHSCNPNCEVDIIDNEIWISSIKKISSGSELTYDYGYSFGSDYMDHECFCGSKNCIGYIISQDDLIKYKKHLKNKIKIVSKAVGMNKKK